MIAWVERHRTTVAYVILAIGISTALWQNRMDALDTKRAACEQATEGRAAARALAVAVVDELTKPPAEVPPEVKADYIERTRKRALEVLPPPDC